MEIGACAVYADAVPGITAMATKNPVRIMSNPIIVDAIRVVTASIHQFLSGKSGYFKLGQSYAPDSKIKEKVKGFVGKGELLGLILLAGRIYVGVFGIQNLFIPFGDRA
jgi:hypothetical protein